MTERLDTHVLASQFNQLTPEDCLEAAETCGEPATGRFLVLNSFENRVYQFEMENGAWIVGKFYRPGRWSHDTITAEHRFIGELVEAEIPAVAPLSLVTGQTIGEVRGIYFALFPRIGGRAPQELSDDQVRMVGRLLGRIHNVGASVEAPERLRLVPETYGWNNLTTLVDNDYIVPEARSVYVETVKVLLSRIEPLFLGVPLHRIHGDCHLGNLIWTGEGPVFLDFDDMVTGPAVQDMWMLVPSADDEGQRQRDVLLDAYQEFRELDPSWLRLVEPLRALRFIHYSTWIARRWHDPIFPHTFNHFGTIQYWEREIQDLREQIARIDHAL